jgi:murein DD-endopeptidase MepM/ murein hydrolase activator NlpD
MVRGIASLIVAVTVGLSLLGGAGVASITASRSFVKPVTGARITQPFGCTPLVIEPYDPMCATRHFHSGIDLAVSRGTPVHATLAGTCQVIDDRTGYGLHVVVDHGGVQSGELVATGQVIGLVGSTGNATGPHLHFEIRIDGVPQDPQLFLHLP